MDFANVLGALVAQPVRMVQMHVLCSAVTLSLVKGALKTARDMILVPKQRAVSCWSRGNVMMVFLDQVCAFVNLHMVVKIAHKIALGRLCKMGKLSHAMDGDPVPPLILNAAASQVSLVQVAARNAR